MDGYDCICTGEIVCPYCGYQFSDSWEFDFGHSEETQIECYACEKTFTVCRNIEVTYSSYKENEDESNV